MGVDRSFLELLELHEDLDELFFSHQEALLALNIYSAERLLRIYDEKLLRHMEDEERLLIPVYRDRAGAIPGGPAELFLGEHRKMKEFIKEFYATLATLEAEGGRPLRRAIVGLLDRQFMYKHLVGHHDLREKNVLYPALDRVTSAEERVALLRACRRTEPTASSETLTHC